MARAAAWRSFDLDMSVPFTAARARNAGFARLLESHPGVERVQFVDGDCEVIDGWLAAANAFLDRRAGCRLRVRPPARAISRAVGLQPLVRLRMGPRRPARSDACGGIVMMRTSAASPTSAGSAKTWWPAKSPSCASESAAKGWEIWRLPDAMAWHDAAMMQFGQWWKRSKRTGFSYAQRIWLLGCIDRTRPTRDRHCAPGCGRRVIPLRHLVGRPDRGPAALGCWCSSIRYRSCECLHHAAELAHRFGARASS